jgi:predicted amidophosphoribosyltransferase
MRTLSFGKAVILDDFARTDHPHLTASDQCWFLARYASGGYRAGSANQLIANLKCAPSAAAAEPVRACYKRRAIEQAAIAVRQAIDHRWAEGATWIPIPPSCAPGHVDYDDRLMRILRTAFARYDADVRSVLYQVRTERADHVGSRRLCMNGLYDCIRVNSAALACRPLRKEVVLFDDVLTTGKHYKCCERRLLEALPGLSISGLFLTRRVLSARCRRLPSQTN